MGHPLARAGERRVAAAARDEAPGVIRWRARITEWTVRSSRAFLLGLVAACAIEVLLDWSVTLNEINVLRNAIRQKGENYVSILGPLFIASGVLDSGRSIVEVCADDSKVDAGALCDGVARYLAPAEEGGKELPVQDAATWARGKTPAGSDVAIVGVRRLATATPS